LARAVVMVIDPCPGSHRCDVWANGEPGGGRAEEERESGGGSAGLSGAGAGSEEVDLPTQETFVVAELLVASWGVFLG